MLNNRGYCLQFYIFLQITTILQSVVTFFTIFNPISYFFRLWSSIFGAQVFQLTLWCILILSELFPIRPIFTQLGAYITE